MKNKLWSSCPCPGRSATGVRLWNLRSGSLPETGESSTCSSGSRCRSWSGWIGRTSQTSRCCKLTKIMIVEIYLVNLLHWYKDRYIYHKKWKCICCLIWIKFVRPYWMVLSSLGHKTSILLLNQFNDQFKIKQVNN